MVISRTREREREGEINCDTTGEKVDYKKFT